MPLIHSPGQFSRHDSTPLFDMPRGTARTPPNFFFLGESVVGDGFRLVSVVGFFTPPIFFPEDFIDRPTNFVGDDDDALLYRCAKLIGVSHASPLFWTRMTLHAAEFLTASHRQDECGARQHP